MLFTLSEMTYQWRIGVATGESLGKTIRSARNVGASRTDIQRVTKLSEAQLDRYLTEQLELGE